MTLDYGDGNEAMSGTDRNDDLPFRPHASTATPGSTSRNQLMTVARRSASHYSAEGGTISRFGGGHNADSDDPVAACRESDADRSTNGGSITEIKRRPSVRPLFQARMSVLKKISFVRFTTLSHLSRPAHERVIYRMIHQLRATTIVEIGLKKALVHSGLSKRRSDSRQLTKSGTPGSTYSKLGRPSPLA